MALLGAAALLALAIGGCGGGGEKENTATGAAQSQAETAPREGSAGEQRGEGKRGEDEAERLKPGAERSFQTYGTEARGAERTAILAAFEGYLRALGAQRFAAACGLLTDTVKASLGRFVAPQLKAKGCATLLPALLAPTAAAIARQQANGEVTRVRVEGNRAFVLFHAPGAKLFLMTMSREGGSWEAALVAASVVVPDL